MIVRPDATATEDIFLLETWQGLGKVRLGYTGIDRVFLLCKECEQGPREIDYWIRGEEPITAGCQQCPQWSCDGNCVGEAVPRILLPTPPTVPFTKDFTANVIQPVPFIKDFTGYAVPQTAPFIKDFTATAKEIVPFTKDFTATAKQPETSNVTISTRVSIPNIATLMPTNQNNYWFDSFELDLSFCYLQISDPVNRWTHFWNAVAYDNIKQYGTNNPYSAYVCWNPGHWTYGSTDDTEILAWMEPGSDDILIKVTLGDSYFKLVPSASYPFQVVWKQMDGTNGAVPLTHDKGNVYTARVSVPNLALSGSDYNSPYALYEIRVEAYLSDWDTGFTGMSQTVGLMRYNNTGIETWRTWTKQNPATEQIWWYEPIIVEMWMENGSDDLFIRIIYPETVIEDRGSTGYWRIDHPSGILDVKSFTFGA